MQRVCIPAEPLYRCCEVVVIMDIRDRLLGKGVKASVEVAP
jgi:hypothetical protein